LCPTNGTCFRCGKKEHMQKEHRLNRNQAPGSLGNNNNNNNKPAPGLCPRCKKGNHWANKCQS
jgi:hypothetical protein